MLVKSLQHGREVFHGIQKQWDVTKRRYLVIDTETKSLRPYPSDDALTIARSRIVIWSLCYRGSSYSFPTSEFASNYPTMAQWAEQLFPFFNSRAVAIVAHNWNYDANVFWFNAGLPVPKNLWCTFIGCWAAAEYQPKGLKERAPLLGRFLRETKTVDFTNEAELAEYAEQDVVAAEELYTTQIYGGVKRLPRLFFTLPNGKSEVVPNVFFQPPFVPENQTLTDFGRLWVRFLELPVLKATLRAERKGLPFDLDFLRKIRKLVVVDKQKATEQLFKQARTRFNPRASRDLARVVESLGIDYPFKTKKGAPSFTAQNLQKVTDTHPFFQSLTSYKKLEKLMSVYVGSMGCNDFYTNDCGLERWINPETGCIHASAGTIEAVTGRGSSSRPNLQQIPSRTDTYGMRHCFAGTPKGMILAPKYSREYMLIVLDYSQLELRIMALLSKDKAMTKILCDPKGDIHQHTADEFGVARDPSAKNLNFLLLYGGQEYMLARTLTGFGVPTDEATALQYKLRHWEVYPRVKAKREEWCHEHQANGRIKLFFGRYRTLPEADWSNEYTTHKAETQLANNAVQGTGQDCLKASIVRSDPHCINPDAIYPLRATLTKQHAAYLKERAAVLEKRRRMFLKADCRFLLQIHDEVIYRVVPSAAEECATALCDIMSWFHYFPGTSSYNVPLVAEGGIGHTWKGAKAKDAAFHVKSGYTHWEKYA